MGFFGRNQVQGEQNETDYNTAERFQTPPTRTRSARQRADRVYRIQEAYANNEMIVSILIFSNFFV
jgi:hypothetical protein